jgi:glycosyltransferase involved in cell wall biosynthesis
MAEQIKDTAIQQKKPVIFFIPTLDVGGAERACLHYVNNLQAVRPILVLQFKRGLLLKEIRPGITVLELNTSTPEQFYRRWPRWLHLFYHSYALLKQARRLSILAEQNRCSAVISFITISNIIAVCAKIFFKPQLKVIINVQDVTSQIIKHSELDRYKRFLLYWLVRILYPKADSIIAVAQGIKKDLIEHFRIPEDKITVLQNPIDIKELKRRAAEPVHCSWCTSKEGPLVIAVGRLVKLKGFDMLIRAFAQLPREINARLIIIGDGKERLALQTLIEQLGLQDRVKLLGLQENPWKYMAYADVFVLSSLTEGLPNVIGEALALGIPILATDCSLGVREYLEDGKYGLLVPPGKSEALVQGIARLLSNELLRKELAQLVQKRAAQFDLSVTVQNYEIFLERIV